MKFIGLIGKSPGPIERSWPKTVLPPFFKHFLYIHIYIYMRTHYLYIHSYVTILFSFRCCIYIWMHWCLLVESYAIRETGVHNDQSSLMECNFICIYLFFFFTIRDTYWFSIVKNFDWRTDRYLLHQINKLQMSKII